MAENTARPTRPALRISRSVAIYVAVLGVIGVIVAIAAFIFTRNLVESWTLTQLPGPAINNSGSPLTINGTVVPTSVLQAPSEPTALPWDGTSRVTILVMGLDYRDWQSGDPPRSDSMWLFTVDPVSKTAGMMSIPRDTWVQIPGFDYAKINTAFFLGAANKLPGGGPALAVKTVENFLGVPINYYAQIDFEAFSTFIDKLDGIYIDVPEEIKVDPIGPGNTVILQPGRQRVFGAVALGYARNRYQGGSDFERSKRQMQVIMAIRDRVMDPKYLPILISAAPSLYQKLSAGIHSNLSLDEAVRLALLIEEINPNNIQKAIIGPNEEIDAKSPDGLSIEIPIYDRIRLLRDQIFTTGGPLSPAASGADPAALAKQENARIEVQNGSQSPGLAGRTETYLKSLGLNVIQSTNAASLTNETTLIDYTGKPYTLNYLVSLMHVGANRVLSKYDPNSPVDVVVVTGQDWANKNSMPNQ